MCTLKVGSSYKNFSLGKSLISDATHRKVASCKLHMHMSLTEDINEINEIPPQRQPRVTHLIVLCEGLLDPSPN